MEYLKLYKTAETSYTPKEVINLSLRLCVGKPENWKIVAVYYNIKSKPNKFCQFF